jgi:hypothetical protein
MTSLSARRTTRGVQLAWRTTGAPDVLGYAAYRERGLRRVALGKPVLAERHAGAARYRLVDPKPGRSRVRYVIEALRADLTRIELGSVVVGPAGPR